MNGQEFPGWRSSIQHSCVTPLYGNAACNASSKKKSRMGILCHKKIINTCVSICQAPKYNHGVCGANFPESKPCRALASSNNHWSIHNHCSGKPSRHQSRYGGAKAPVVLQLQPAPRAAPLLQSGQLRSKKKPFLRSSAKKTCLQTFS